MGRIIFITMEKSNKNEMNLINNNRKINKLDSYDIPKEFICPLTLVILENPYVDNEGITYEYEAIKSWLKNNNTSPISRGPLALGDLRPNLALKNLIED